MPDAIKRREKRIKEFIRLELMSYFLDTSTSVIYEYEIEYDYDLDFDYTYEYTYTYNYKYNRWGKSILFFCFLDRL